MSWGNQTDEHEAREQLTAFVDAGGTLLDTAHTYAGGASEELLGKLLREVVARDDVVVATKAGVGMRRGTRVRDTSRGYLLSCLDVSLQRLGVDHVDLWQVHVWSDATPIEETLSALDTAVATGRTAYVGISNWPGWRTAQGATWQQAVPGRAPLVSTQVEYSLLNRGVEHEVVPAAEALGLGVLPWSPLGRGVLTGKYRTGTPSDSRGASDGSQWVDVYRDESSSQVVEAVVRAADGLGWTPLEVALAWVRDRRGVTAPIVGARTAAQLRQALAVEARTLPAELVQALDDVSSERA
jgi:aryl-alcohol dehydrogenase-like predicted oxidoreductase